MHTSSEQQHAWIWSDTVGKILKSCVGLCEKEAKFTISC